MNLLLALLVGGLAAAGFYLILRGSTTRLVFGFVLLAHALTLLLVSAAGAVRFTPPVALSGESRIASPFADPVLQALVLTALVIGFGVQACLIALLRRASDVPVADDSAASNGRP